MSKFEPIEGREDIAGTIREGKREHSAQYKTKSDLAIMYLQGKQIDDVVGELHRRYERTQNGGSGQQIEPVAVPLVERYVAEAASLYNRPVKRRIVNVDTGETNEQMTEEYHYQLGEAQHDMKMHQVEQVQKLLGDVGVWYQAKAGKLRLVMTPPQSIYPIMAESGDSFVDPSDQADYTGYVIQVDDAQPGKSGSEKLYAFVTPAQTHFFKSKKPHDVQGEVTSFDNPFRWEQTVDTEDRRGSSQTLPLQMFTIWSEEQPVGDVMLRRDSDITFANRELNIQWSLLLDTIRVQGWDTTVLNVLDPDKGYREIPHGSRFPAVLGSGESMSKITSATPYTEIVNSLENFVKTLAVSHRMSPNDFAIDAVAPASGFAKLVDSLPKLEAREEHAAKMKDAEERIAWPRIASIGSYLGWEGFTEGSVAAHKLVVEFSDISFPRTVAEEAAHDKHMLELNLTTPAKILAKKRGISVDEAQQEIDENKEGEPEPEPEQQEQQGGLLGQLIGQRGSRVAQR